MYIYIYILAMKNLSGETTTHPPEICLDFKAYRSRVWGLGCSVLSLGFRLQPVKIQILGVKV